MSEWQSGDLEVNGLRLHYTRTGGTKPPLVLAHGFSDDGLCWTPVAMELAAAYDVIMVDARGHGRSEGPEQGYGHEAHAADVAGVITGLQLSRPAVLGHSMGAATALALAGTYPDLPGAILLEDPPAWWVAGSLAGFDTERQARMRASIVALKRKLREELIADQRAATPGWSAAELEPWADSKLRLSFNVINRIGGGNVDWPALVQRITCPVLLITADPARGAIVTKETAIALQALAPQTRVVHIPDAGHRIRRDQCAPDMEAVRAFLAEHVKVTA
ncbi:MAG: alpha/beta hydrolase [Chloroflexi bacterium]|nr:alpha/beta hydrolase [Chloroflexota bacterium]